MEIKDEDKQNIVVDALLNKIIELSDTISLNQKAIEGLTVEKDEYKKEVSDRFKLSTTIGRIYGEYADNKISLIDLASKIAEASGQPFEIPEESLEEVKNLKDRLAEKEQEVSALRQRVRDLDEDNAKSNDSVEKRIVCNVYIIKAKRISEQSKDGITWLEDENGTRFKIKAPYQKPLNTYGIPVEKFPFK